MGAGAGSGVVTRREGPMSTIVLDLEADRMLAVEATLQGDRVRVRRSFTADAPVSVREADDPEAVGAWVRERLDEHGIRGRRVIVAAGRGEVLVKRLEAPAEGLSRGERHEMICLQMSRQASLTSASSVIDYVESAPSGPDGGAGFVVASAMPGERVRAREAAASAAGLKLAGIRLRTAGVRALLAEELDAGCPTLVVNPGVGSVELLMLIDGEVVFSRSISVGLPDEGAAAFAERVAVEASRTMVSFRVSAEGREIDRAVILAGGGVGAALAEEIGARLEMPAQTLDPATLIAFDDSVDARDHAAIAPLAGLLLCKARGIRAHDFANPTGPPDTTAGVRQLALGGVFLLVVLVGAGWVFGQRALAEAGRQRDAAREDHDEAQRRWRLSQLDGARLGHLGAFTERRIDVPGHLSHIMSLLPDAESVALGQIAGVVDHAAVFEQGGTLGDPESWSSVGGLTLTLSGVSRDRDHITRFREALLGSGLYTVSSQGPEVEDRFVLRIGTSVPSPVPEGAQGDLGAEPDEGGAGGQAG
jgi:Tfp pilus assembly PilM family ATPase